MIHKDPNIGSHRHSIGIQLNHIEHVLDHITCTSVKRRQSVRVRSQGPGPPVTPLQEAPGGPGAALVGQGQPQEKGIPLRFTKMEMDHGHWEDNEVLDK